MSGLDPAAADATAGHGRPPQAEEPFVLTAMLSLIAATAWLAYRPHILLEFYYGAELLALTHIVTLGFATSIAMGVALRLAPIATGVGARSQRLALVQYGMFAIGASGIIIHFAWSSWVAVAWAGILLTLAALLQLVNFAALWPRAWRGDLIAAHVVAAHANLALAAALGMTYGMHNAGYRWAMNLYSASFFERLSAHFHLAAVGWITTLIFGFQLKLVPTTARIAGRPILWLRFALLQVGLAGLVITQLAAARGQLGFALMVATAVLLQAVGPLRAIRLRRDFRFDAVALAILCVLAVTGILLLCGIPNPLHQIRFRVQMAYGYLALFAWLPLTVSAVGLRLFPLWVWQERFAADFGKKPVPAVAELRSPRLQAASGWLITVGTLCTAVGIVLAALPVVWIATKLVLLGVAAFAVSFIRVARWELFPKLEWRGR